MIVRILQLHNLQRGYGGADEVIRYERDLLSAAGHDVEQLFLPAVAEAKASMALKPSYNRAFTRQLAATIAEYRPDIVHTHTPFPLMSPAVFRTAKQRGCATVATLHAYRYSCVKGTMLRGGALCEKCIGRRLKIPAVVHKCYHDSRFASASMATGLTLHHVTGTLRRDVDRFIALTPYGREIAIRDGMPAGKVVVKPNSVPDPGDAPEPGLGDGSVVFVGRLVPEKGIHTLAQAWLRGGDELPRLVIAGDGVLRAEVADLARQRPNVEWRGWLQEDEISALVTASSAVVVTSEWAEGGSPLVMLRALALRRPVITSDVANMRDLVRTKALGVTFRAGDADSLVAATRALMGDHDRLASYSANARACYLENYSPSANLRALLSIYEDVLAGVTTAD